MKPSLQSAFTTAIELHQSGRPREAEKLCRSVLQQDPRHAGALYLLGLVALAAKRPQRAADLLGRSIRSNPDFPPAYCNLGIALAAMNRSAEALKQYDAALARNPAFGEAHYNRGVLLKEVGRHAAALDSFDAALALRPDDVETLNERGLVLSSMARYVDALDAFDRAIRLRADFAPGHCNRGMTLTWLKRHAEALGSLDRAVALQPGLAEAWCNRGNALLELNRPDDAITSFDKAIALRPDFAEAHFGRSLSLLTVGRYAEGFRECEWRKRRPGAAKLPSFRQPLWLGKAGIAGRTLLIYPELYLGDMVQFCRYALLAVDRGAKVVLAVPPPLRELIGSMDPDIAVIDAAATSTTPEMPTPDLPSCDLPAFDLQCPLLSLPLAFGTTLESVPAPVPYLHAEPRRIAEWQQKIGKHGLKIGVCWQGSPSRLELDRSFPLAAFAGISGLPSVRLISLQTGFGLEQLDALPAGMHIEHFDDTSDSGLRPFVVLAAMMASVDLIITTDTVVAHVAGALGRPAWVVLKEAPDWRWGQQDTTPWYPTLRLFRQQKSGDWTGVFNTIQAALQDHFQPSPACQSAVV